MKMNQYRMVWHTILGEPGWQYDYTMASDEMAVEYAMKHMARSKALQSADILSLLVWRVETARLIGELTFGPISVVNKVA